MDAEAAPTPDTGAPRRWLIVGGSGSGKSTLARRMGARLSLPVIHLDRHYWNTAWTPTPNDEFDQIVADLAAGDAWVMDGNYSRTLHLRLPRAQAVVLLDRNPLLCLARVAVRGNTLSALLDLDVVAEIELPPQPFFNHRQALRVTERELPAPPLPAPVAGARRGRWGLAGS